MEDAGIRADGEGEEKAASNGVQRVVWLRQMLHRWQSSSSSSAAANTSSVTSGGDGDGTNGPHDASTDRNNDDDDATTPAAGNNSGDSERNPLLAAPASEERRRLPRVVVVEERGRPDDGAAEACSSPMTPMTPDSPAGVPRGCCPVYVGAERRRFVVPTSYLGMPVFRRLLEKAEEEFEFHYHGGALTIPCDTEAFKYILLVMGRHRQGLVDDEGNAKDGEQQDGSQDR